VEGILDTNVVIVDNSEEKKKQYRQSIAKLDRKVREIARKVQKIL
jgi:hypothetical protein